MQTGYWTLKLQSLICSAHCWSSNSSTYCQIYHNLLINCECDHSAQESIDFVSIKHCSKMKSEDFRSIWQCHLFFSRQAWKKNFLAYYLIFQVDISIIHFDITINYKLVSENWISPTKSIGIWKFKSTRKMPKHFWKFNVCERDG